MTIKKVRSLSHFPNRFYYLIEFFLSNVLKKNLITSSTGITENAKPKAMANSFPSIAVNSNKLAKNGT